MDYASKKTLHAIEQEREDVKAERDEWRTAQSKLKIDKLVFLDESGTNTDMTRLYGRAPSDERIVDYTT